MQWPKLFEKRIRFLSRLKPPRALVDGDGRRVRFLGGTLKAEQRNPLKVAVLRQHRGDQFILNLQVRYDEEQDRIVPLYPAAETLHLWWTQEAVKSLLNPNAPGSRQARQATGSWRR